MNNEIDIEANVFVEVLPEIEKGELSIKLKGLPPQNEAIFFMFAALQLETSLTMYFRKLFPNELKEVFSLHEIASKAGKTLNLKINNINNLT